MDAAMGSDEDAQKLEARLGVNDDGFERVEQQQWMKWVLQQVTPMERLLLEKRFIELLGQRETAKALGVSQMQISRMERKILARLRELTERWNTIH
jgi:RNA polymerase sigma-B factor